MLYFFLGFIIGLSIFAWHSYQLNVQLKEILLFLSQVDDVKGLGNIAQLRRKVNRLNHHFYYTQLELKIYHELIDNLPLGYLRISKNNCLIECNLEAKKLLNIQRWEDKSLRFF